MESLAAGCPLIISDKTPWLNLEEKEIGWDLALNKPEIWSEKLNYCISLDQKEYSRLSRNARKFAESMLSEKTTEADTVRILNYGLRSTYETAAN